MIIDVHMFAFADEGNRNHVRKVDVPDNEAKSTRTLEDLLELVFRYGQNDIQSKATPSVSAGDVIELQGRYFMIMSCGFMELSVKDFKKLVPPTSSKGYNLGFKK